jgi:hypothetical protein
MQSSVMVTPTMDQIVEAMDFSRNLDFSGVLELEVFFQGPQIGAATVAVA